MTTRLGRVADCSPGLGSPNAGKIKGRHAIMSVSHGQKVCEDDQNIARFVRNILTLTLKNLSMLVSTNKRASK